MSTPTPTTARELPSRLKARLTDVFLGTPRAERYDRTLAVVVEAFGSDHGMFGHVDEDGAIVSRATSAATGGDPGGVVTPVLLAHQSCVRLQAAAVATRRSAHINEPVDSSDGVGGTLRAITAPILSRGKVIASVLLAGRESDYTDADLELIEAVARFMSPPMRVEIEEQRQEDERRDDRHAMGERIKELRAIYDIARLSAQARGIEDLLRRTAEVIVVGWQYPDITAARVTVDNHSFTTAGFAATDWVQTAAITVNGAARGEIWVAYLQECPPAAEGPFLREERELLDGIALLVGTAVHRLETRRLLELESRVRLLFSTVADDEEMYHSVLGIVLEEMQSRFGVFGYLDERGDFVVPSMTRHIWEKCRVPDKRFCLPARDLGRQRVAPSHSGEEGQLQQRAIHADPGRSRSYRPTHLPADHVRRGGDRGVPGRQQGPRLHRTRRPTPGQDRRGRRSRAEGPPGARARVQGSSGDDPAHGACAEAGVPGGAGRGNRARLQQHPRRHSRAG